jgi:protein-disulfide isomerase
MIAVLVSAFVIAQAAAQHAPASPAPGRVELVVYSDFQCPFCAVFSKALREVQTKGVDGIPVSVVFKHFPLSFHTQAPLAHRASLAAGEQGKFWEMHDLLFANQRRLQRDDLIAYAKDLGLNLKRFAADLEADRLERTVEADQAEGVAHGVDGTPAFFVNGRGYSGAKSLQQLTALIVAERQRTQALAEITDDLMAAGPAGAPVTIELFADLQSPVTPPAVAVVNDVMKRYPAAVRLQFRNLPLAFHAQAPLAHEAAATAARDGHFWAFVAYLIAHQDSLREQDLIALAGRLGLDEATFASSLHQHRYVGRVEADMQLALRRGIRGSPALLVNGRRIDGVPSVQQLTDYVEAALKAKPATLVEKP